MDKIARARKLTLVAISAAVAGGAAVVPANAADARMSQAATTMSLNGPTTLNPPDDPNPPDQPKHKAHIDDDTPKMGACQDSRCRHRRNWLREQREQREWEEKKWTWQRRLRDKLFGKSHARQERDEEQEMLRRHPKVHHPGY
ncbi:hypothetical protein [Nonomuraea sediminis]|uniref:hypothetical protein n=1 Tax=Nonomuraea sediminis TaxID=2835864 RepID=UPI001BDCD636|nr:hypothetical protein [Nonomuraea sediminis]